MGRDGVVSRETAWKERCDRRACCRFIGIIATLFVVTTTAFFVVNFRRLSRNMDISSTIIRLHDRNDSILQPSGQLINRWVCINNFIDLLSLCIITEREFVTRLPLLVMCRVYFIEIDCRNT